MSRRQRGVMGEINKTVEHKQGNEVVKDEEEIQTTDIIEFEEEPAVVEVTGSSTYNLGNYNSAKVGVSIRIPCDNTDEAIRETYNKCSDYVLEFINNEQASLVDESE